MSKQLPSASAEGAAICCALALTLAIACDDGGHAPHGSSSGGPQPSGSNADSDSDGDSDADSDSDTDSDTGSDTDADTDEDAGTDGCLDEEVAEPDEERCWLSCALGQEWNDGFCDGPAQVYDWEGAVAACALRGGGYHLASRQEMIDILSECEAVLEEDQEGFCDPCGASPACGAMFGFDTLTYWTSSDGLYSPWAVAFDTGLVFMSSTEFDIHHGRCVRDL